MYAAIDTAPAATPSVTVNGTPQNLDFRQRMHFYNMDNWWFKIKLVNPAATTDRDLQFKINQCDLLSQLGIAAFAQATTADTDAPFTASPRPPSERATFFNMRPGIRTMNVFVNGETSPARTVFFPTDADAVERSYEYMDPVKTKLVNKRRSYEASKPTRAVPIEIRVGGTRSSTLANLHNHVCHLVLAVTYRAPP